MSSYRIVHREEPMIQGRTCHVITCARVQEDGKVSETDIIRIQSQGVLPAESPTGTCLAITIAPQGPDATDPKG
jgi:hypothetical protein